MPKYTFPGDLPYLERAARELHPDAPIVDVASARRSPAFAAVSRSLTALAEMDVGEQRFIDDPDEVHRRVADFLAGAARGRDSIATTLAAADLMIADAGAAFGDSDPESSRASEETPPEPELAPMAVCPAPPMEDPVHDPVPRPATLPGREIETKPRRRRREE